MQKQTFDVVYKTCVECLGPSRQPVPSSSCVHGGNLTSLCLGLIVSLRSDFSVLTRTWIPRHQEGSRVKLFTRKLHYLLGLDPATIHKLEALQVNNLEKQTTPSL